MPLPVSTAVSVARAIQRSRERREERQPRVADTDLQRTQSYGVGSQVHQALAYRELKRRQDAKLARSEELKKFKTGDLRASVATGAYTVGGVSAVIAAPSGPVGSAVAGGIGAVSGGVGAGMGYTARWVAENVLPEKSPFQGVPIVQQMTGKGEYWGNYPSIPKVSQKSSFPGIEIKSGGKGREMRTSDVYDLLAFGGVTSVTSKGLTKGVLKVTKPVTTVDVTTKTVGVVDPKGVTKSVTAVTKGTVKTKSILGTKETKLKGSAKDIIVPDEHTKGVLSPTISVSKGTVKTGAKLEIVKVKEKVGAEAYAKHLEKTGKVVVERPFAASLIDPQGGPALGAYTSSSTLRHGYAKLGMKGMSETPVISIAKRVTDPSRADALFRHELFHHKIATSRLGDLADKVYPHFPYKYNPEEFLARLASKSKKPFTIEKAVLKEVKPSSPKPIKFTGAERKVPELKVVSGHKEVVVSKVKSKTAVGGKDIVSEGTLAQRTQGLGIVDDMLRYRSIAKGKFKAGGLPGEIHVGSDVTSWMKPLNVKTGIDLRVDIAKRIIKTKKPITSFFDSLTGKAIKKPIKPKVPLKGATKKPGKTMEANILHDPVKRSSGGSGGGADSAVHLDVGEIAVPRSIGEQISKSIVHQEAKALHAGVGLHAESIEKIGEAFVLTPSQLIIPGILSQTRQSSGMVQPTKTKPGVVVKEGHTSPFRSDYSNPLRPSHPLKSRDKLKSEMESPYELKDEYRPAHPSVNEFVFSPTVPTTKIPLVPIPLFSFGGGIPSKGKKKGGLMEWEVKHKIATPWEILGLPNPKKRK